MNGTGLTVANVTTLASKELTVDRESAISLIKTLIDVYNITVDEVYNITVDDIS